MRSAKSPAGWVVTEVKATKSVKPQHYADAAVQAQVVERAGLPVTRVELMHLNGEHRHPDQGPLFIRADITSEVDDLRTAIPAQAAAQLRAYCEHDTQVMVALFRVLQALATRQG